MVVFQSLGLDGFVVDGKTPSYVSLIERCEWGSSVKAYSLVEEYPTGFDRDLSARDGCTVLRWWVPLRMSVWS
ncbi:hypothetical protein Cflav_PD6465 [Pedosphaera parvula Ellin514]|uniref:Uncharacterized protein n=1 Tax=Pedosphaera parvula (strain Ellin514) TaxID=320771 RepID=B9XDP4_PEDPL|nr:hypothetical protein Cflav_PD6465 [Pedosphaera parvula Ellin514]